MTTLLSRQDTLPLPEVGEAHYMLNLFDEMGGAIQTGMGLSAITWIELNSWLEVSESELSIWEKLTLREMSIAYAAELSIASEKLAIPPYIEDKKAAPDLDNRLKMAFKSLNKKRG